MRAFVKRSLTLIALVAAPHLASADCARDADGSRFQVTDAIVTDIASGLTWTRCPAGQTVSSGATECTGGIADLTWNEADAFARARGGGWRLPTLEEIETLRDPACAALWPAAFPLPATEIWTASPGFPVNDVAAIVDTASGAVWGTGKGVARGFLLVSGRISGDF